ncbi:hypothetical protein ACFL6Y_10945 [Elusimicrobiota bacterium]
MRSGIIKTLGVFSAALFMCSALASPAIAADRFVTALVLAKNIGSNQLNYGKSISIKLKKEAGRGAFRCDNIDHSGDFFEGEIDFEGGSFAGISIMLLGCSSAPQACADMVGKTVSGMAGSLMECPDDRVFNTIIIPIKDKSEGSD